MEADRMDLEGVLAFADRLIAQNKPEEAAFWIGYQWGIRHRFFGDNPLVRPESLRFFLEITEQGHSDKFLNAYARGYLNGIEGIPARELIGQEEGGMAETTRFQRINGCSVCKHAKHRDEKAGIAAERDKAFWCGHFTKAVNWKEGATCPEWACEK